MAAERPRATQGPMATISATIPKVPDTGPNSDGNEKDVGQELEEEGSQRSTSEDGVTHYVINFGPMGLTDLSRTGIPLIDFRVFSTLPQEMQNRVWMFAAYAEERVVELRFASSTLSPRHLFKATIPAILHATKHSRAEGLRYYKSLCNEKSANGAYVNFSTDYLYIREAQVPGPWAFTAHGCTTQVKLVMPYLPFKADIQNLAISSTSLSRMQLTRYQTIERTPTILWFPNLARVTFLYQTTVGRDDDISPRLKYGSLEECDCYINDVGEDAAKSNKAVFFSQEELQYHLENHCGHPDDEILLAKEAIEFFMNNVIKKKLDAKWKVPVFKIGGVMHDHKAKDSFWCLPWGPTRVRSTRSKGFIADY